ncbi:MAG TPA: DNA-directed RNA polymerase subunit omega [Candidatus Brocadiales bacterium]|nr:DNA-directed RNA polymerase subunit omega [Candidatus Brocadiales bacterium]
MSNFASLNPSNKMDYKKTNAEVTTVTRDVRQLDKTSGNIYETIAILGKRANQIGADIREELTGKLQEFATHTDNLEEIFENREQIEISKFYERLAKPSDIAIEEYLEDKIYFRNPLLETQEETK